jgi:hypothetical protein
MIMSKCYTPIILFLISSNVLAATCSNSKTECIEAGETRIQDSVLITLDCWRYKTTYECKEEKEESDNNCQQLREQGDFQVGSSCRALWDSTCAIQDEVYQYPIGQHNEDESSGEEVRSIKRLCEKVPVFTTTIKDIVYPNCQNLVIQNGNNYCPPGYVETLYSDMAPTINDKWDDIRFCQKTMSTSESSECYSGGFYVARAVGGNFGSERAVVPKKLHARIKIRNVYFGTVMSTIINETTGQIIYNNIGFSNGQVIELPYSDTQDQVFRFYAVQQTDGRWWPRKATGVMVLYIDHIGKDREANVVWQESCHVI